jgi:hypothetical protein
VLYVLPKDYRSLLLAKSLKLRLEPLVDKIKVHKFLLNSPELLLDNSFLIQFCIEPMDIFACVMPRRWLEMHIFNKTFEAQLCGSDLHFFRVLNFGLLSS